MGTRDEQDDVIGGKGETEIKMLKQEVENIVEGLVSWLDVKEMLPSWKNLWIPTSLGFNMI